METAVKLNTAEADTIINTLTVVDKKIKLDSLKISSLKVELNLIHNMLITAVTVYESSNDSEDYDKS